MEPLNSAKHNLHGLRAKIEELESTAKLLTDGRFRIGAFWANASDGDIVSEGLAKAESTGCACKKCKVRHVTRAFEAAVQRAERYSARLAHDVEKLEELQKKWCKPVAAEESAQQL